MNVNSIVSEGTIFKNKYRILKQLRQGIFAKTYLVENVEDNQTKYILKEFLPNNYNAELNHKYLSLFNGEISTLNNLNHPQIPKFLECFQENNNFFLVQQYIQGDNYWQLFCQKKEHNQLFSEAEIIQFLKDLLNVLIYIHKNNIIHRDISPDNIIYSTEINKPVLIDFGGVKQEITKIIDDNYEHKKGTMIGKIGYSAPEQLRSGNCYKNSDIYALGVTALVLLTGEEPEVLFKNFGKEKSWIKYVNFSDKLRLILEKMLAEYSEERYSNANEVLKDLEAIHLTDTRNQNIQQQDKNISSMDLEKTLIIIPKPLDNIQTTILQKSENKFSKTLVLFCLFIILGLGGIAFILQVPHITAICKKLDNCARDKKYQEIFNEILVDGKDIINREKTFKNKQDLTIQRESLSAVIKDLQNIPDDVKIRGEAQEELKVYENKLTQLDKKIKVENKADLEFQEIVKKMDSLHQETSQANSINKYQTLKAEWEGLKTKLNEFDGNLFISPQVSNKIIESEKNITKIDDNLKILQAQAKAKAEQIAMEKAKQNTYKPSPPVVRYKPPQNTSKITRQIPKKSPVFSNNKQNITKPQKNYSPKKTPSAPPNKNISTPGSVW